MVDARQQRSQTSLSLHTPNSDQLYRWTMWRVNINEDLSQNISHWRDFGDHSATVNSVALPYLKHPDCSKYGKLMRRRFGRERDTMYYRSRLKLSDSQFWVFGIPRASLAKPVPTDLQKLYRSCPNYLSSFDNLNKKESANGEPISGVNGNQRSNFTNENDEITELFKFVSSENTQNTSSQAPDNKMKSTEANQVTNSSLQDADITNVDSILSDAIDQERLVTRSKVFWKKLAQRKQDIIELGKKNERTRDRTHQEYGISNDILLKQTKMLTAMPKPKPQRDLWRPLADQNTETLKRVENLKQKESKSSQLWNFIASKKNEILHIKRCAKSLNDTVGAKQGNQKSVTVFRQDSSEHKSESILKLSDFQNSFQRELEEKLRKRRTRLQPEQEHM